MLPAGGRGRIASPGRISANLRETVTLVTAGYWPARSGACCPSLDGAAPRPDAREVVPGSRHRVSGRTAGHAVCRAGLALWIVNSVYSIGYMRGNNEKPDAFLRVFALSLAATMGIAFAGNLLTLFLFYEILTLSTYPLVSHKGDAATVRSARVYLGILLTTSIGLFLPAIVWTYNIAGTGDFIAGGILEGHVRTGPAVGLLLGLFVFGIGKAAVMPVHRWLPAAMVAPTPVSALLHAVAVVKAGVFTITKVIVLHLRRGLPVCVSRAAAGWMYAAAFTVIAASVVALAPDEYQAPAGLFDHRPAVLRGDGRRHSETACRDRRRDSHGGPRLRQDHPVLRGRRHLYVASKKTEVIQLRGIGRRMPWTMAAFTIGALSMIGVPPTGGFVSKWYILAGAFQADNYVAIATIILSTALNAAYFLPIIYMAWFSKEDAGDGKSRSRRGAVAAVLALTVTAILTIASSSFSTAGPSSSSAGRERNVMNEPNQQDHWLVRPEDDRLGCGASSSPCWPSPCSRSSWSGQRVFRRRRLVRVRRRLSASCPAWRWCLSAKAWACS